MIGELSIEYSCARVGARLAQRPDDRLWLQIRSARSVPALLEVIRASTAAPTVSGIPLSGDPDVIELAFRQQLRTRIEEVAAWSPQAWRAAVLYTRHLVDLPAIAHLLLDESPPRWFAADPVLARYAHEGHVERRKAILAGPLAPIAEAIEAEAPARAAIQPLARAFRRIRSGPVVHRALTAWDHQWRLRWPRIAEDARAALDDLARLIQHHLLRFATLGTGDAPVARQGLATRLIALLHRNSAHPVALFAYLALFALDLEHLRGEFVVRARLGPTA